MKWNEYLLYKEGKVAVPIKDKKGNTKEVKMDMFVYMDILKNTRIRKLGFNKKGLPIVKIGWFKWIPLMELVVKYKRIRNMFSIKKKIGIMRKRMVSGLSDQSIQEAVDVLGSKLSSGKE